MILNYLKFSIILLPPLLVTGSFIPDLVVSLNSLIFIFYIKKHKIYHFLNWYILNIFFILSIFKFIKFVI